MKQNTQKSEIRTWNNRTAQGRHSNERKNRQRGKTANNKQQQRTGHGYSRSIHWSSCFLAVEGRRRPNSRNLLPKETQRWQKWNHPLLHHFITRRFFVTLAEAAYDWIRKLPRQVSVPDFNRNWSILTIGGYAAKRRRSKSSRRRAWKIHHRIEAQLARKTLLRPMLSRISTSRMSWYILRK